MEYPCAERVGIGCKPIGIPIRRGVGWGSSNTGYQRKELTSEVQIKLLERVSVLIDGEYKEELNDGAFLRGSSNQVIHILSDQYRDKYEKYISGNHNEIQNFMINNEVISVGIHNRKFRF